jgi:hypothetical protein
LLAAPRRLAASGVVNDLSENSHDLVGFAKHPSKFWSSRSVLRQTKNPMAASSHADFIAKNRIALKEAKETRFRLRVGLEP